MSTQGARWQNSSTGGRQIQRQISEIDELRNTVVHFTLTPVPVIKPVLSVVNPLRRLDFDPLAATNRNYAGRVLLARQGSSR